MEDLLTPPTPIGSSTPSAPVVQRIPSPRRHVLSIEGVGDHYAAKLKELGISTIGDLWTAQSDAVAAHLEVPVSVVEKWRAMGELMDVTGIGPQFSELLVRCGVESVAALAACRPDELMAMILITSAEREVRIQGAPLGIKHMERWIRAAKEYLDLPSTNHKPS